LTFPKRGNSTREGRGPRSQPCKAWRGAGGGRSLRTPPFTRPRHLTTGSSTSASGQTKRLERRHAQLVARLDVQLDARFDFTRIMRCVDNHDFARVQRGMRSTTSVQPVPDDLVAAFRAVTATDLAEDERWRFAPVGVLSHLDGQLDEQLGQLDRQLNQAPHPVQKHANQPQVRRILV